LQFICLYIVIGHRHHHEISSASITPWMHYSVSVYALNRSLWVKN